jgi:hypothetical protein
MVVVDYLKSYSFPKGLCKTVVNYVENTPWRIILVDCSSAVETASVDRLVGTARSPPTYVTVAVVVARTPLTDMHQICCCSHFRLKNNPLLMPSDLSAIVLSIYFPVCITYYVHSLTTCTRWQDLGESLMFCAGLARTAHAPTDFRFGTEPVPLSSTPNPMTFAKTATVPTPIVVGDPSEEDGTGRVAGRVRGMRAGRTALCRDLADILAEIKEEEQVVGGGDSLAGGGPAPATPKTPSGSRTGSGGYGSGSGTNSGPNSGSGFGSGSAGRSKQCKVSIVICTDSVPADGDIGPVLAALAALGTVNVVVRLCTDDVSVWDFWLGRGWG